VRGRRDVARALVIDASVALKWLLDEPLSGRAAELVESAFSDAIRLVAPDLLLVEMAHVFWRKERRGELRGADVDAAVEQLTRLPVRTVPSRWLWEPALGCARDTGASVYDAMYVALADRLGVPLVTADAALVRVVNRGAYAGVAVDLGEWASDR
jgi:predicted nucleic acid-binding protein